MNERRRVQLLHLDMEELDDRFQPCESKLTTTNKCYEEEEVAMKLLEAKEARSDVHIARLEVKVKDMRLKAEQVPMILLMQHLLDKYHHYENFTIIVEYSMLYNISNLSVFPLLLFLPLTL